MGMSSSEWSRYMRSELGVPMEPDEISAAVVEGLQDLLPAAPSRCCLTRSRRCAPSRSAGRWRSPPRPTGH